ncbi:MAG: nucleotidyltransferase family protein [Promethearchaeota archaeon]
MKNRLHLKEEIKEKIISILVKHGIKRILVFGSYARNEATTKSDLDLIVDFPEGTSLLDHIGIEMELSEVLNMKIDLLSRNGISPYIKDHVLREAIVIYE